MKRFTELKTVTYINWVITICGYFSSTGLCDIDTFSFLTLLHRNEVYIYLAQLSIIDWLSQNVFTFTNTNQLLWYGIVSFDKPVFTVVLLTPETMYELRLGIGSPRQYPICFVIILLNC